MVKPKEASNFTVPLRKTMMLCFSLKVVLSHQKLLFIIVFLSGTVNLAFTSDVTETFFKKAGWE